MKNKPALIVKLILLSFALQSCSMDTPENYFDRTTLNTNSLHKFGKEDFDHMRELKKGNMMYATIDGELKPTNSYQAYIKTDKLVRINNYIEKVEKLKPTDDTKAMIEASLEVFNFVKSKYETDYLEIAKLMEEEVDDKIIEERIYQFEQENLEKFIGKVDALWEIATIYADDNGIKIINQ